MKRNDFSRSFSSSESLSGGGIIRKSGKTGRIGSNLGAAALAGKVVGGSRPISGVGNVGTTSSLSTSHSKRHGLGALLNRSPHKSSRSSSTSSHTSPSSMSSTTGLHSGSATSGHHSGSGSPGHQSASGSPGHHSASGSPSHGPTSTPSSMTGSNTSGGGVKSQFGEQMIPRSGSGKSEELIRILMQSSPLQPSQLGKQSLGLQSGPTISLDSPHSRFNVGLPSPSPSASNISQQDEKSALERMTSLVQLDHSYAKQWSQRLETSLCLPTKTLYVNKLNREETRANNYLTGEDDTYIDVEDVPASGNGNHYTYKGVRMLTECERYVDFLNPKIHEFEEEDDLLTWEERVVKDGWTPQQMRLYREIVKILQQDRLSRLAQEGVENKIVLRRLSADKAAKRVRSVLGSHPVLWDTKLVQWLHVVLTEHLPKAFLAAWLEIIQTLRSKIPVLVDRMMSLVAPQDPVNIRQVTQEGINWLLKRRWDPDMAITRSRLTKLNTNPVIIVAPPGPTDPRFLSRRMRDWNNQLGCIGKVIVINLAAPKGEMASKTTVTQYLHQMIAATLAKVREVKLTAQASGGPEKPIVLMGWGVGGAIAVHVANMEKLSGLVCLGFPLYTLDGIRGQVGDPLLELKTPTLFVIGEKASWSKVIDLEDLRERLCCETGLVIVGSAGNTLRVGRKKREREGLTQGTVDRAIIEEIREFLATVLPHQVNQLPASGDSAATTAGFAVPASQDSTAAGTEATPSQSSKRSGGGRNNRKRNASTTSTDGPGNAKKGGAKAPPGVNRSFSSPAGSPSKTPLVGSNVAPGGDASTPFGIINTASAKGKRSNSSRRSGGNRSQAQRKRLKMDESGSFTEVGKAAPPGNPLPPGLLSISAPLPQETLPSTSADFSPPPLPIRVPLEISSIGGMPAMQAQTTANHPIVKGIVSSGLSLGHSPTVVGVQPPGVTTSAPTGRLIPNPHPPTGSPSLQRVIQYAPARHLASPAAGTGPGSMPGPRFGASSGQLPTVSGLSTPAVMLDSGARSRHKLAGQASQQTGFLTHGGVSLAVRTQAPVSSVASPSVIGSQPTPMTPGTDSRRIATTNLGGFKSSGSPTVFDDDAGTDRKSSRGHRVRRDYRINHDLGGSGGQWVSKLRDPKSHRVHRIRKSDARRCGASGSHLDVLGGQRTIRVAKEVNGHVVVELINQPAVKTTTFGPAVPASQVATTTLPTSSAVGQSLPNRPPAPGSGQSST